MRNKKVIAGLVAAMTLVSTATAIVSAAGDFTVSISNTTAKAGEEFSLTLNMADIPSTGINGCDFGISYESDLVTIDEVTLGSLAKDVSTLEGDLPDPFEVNIEDDVISLMYAIGTTDSTYYLNGSGTFLNITGTVKATAAAGEKADFEVVPVDRAAKPGSTDTNATIVFGYMGEDEKSTVYTPVYEAGWVEVKGEDPTEPPTVAPTEPPTVAPTEPPTVAPTEPPTVAPTEPPTVAPTEPSSDDPTVAPTEPSSSVTIDPSLVTKYGDVNVDGTVDAADVVALNMYLINNTTNALEPAGVANADVVKNNVIDSTDGALLMNAVSQTASMDDLGK